MNLYLENTFSLIESYKHQNELIANKVNSVQQGIFFSPLNKSDIIGFTWPKVPYSTKNYDKKINIQSGL